MQFQKMAISDVVLIIPTRFDDNRGHFSETFRADFFNTNVASTSFVQDNQSLTAEVGTVRGLHFQAPPRAQGKLVRCIAGAILDVAVDIRRNLPTYGRHVKAELTAENGHQLWVPPGFAHGFCTLKPNSIISYKVTDYYSQDHDQGLLWNDPDIAIEWPFEARKAILSDKDKAQPRFVNFESVFVN